jgi:hypothetical protein
VPVVRKQRIAVYVLTTFFGLQVGFAGGGFLLGLPFLNYQPPYWRTLLIYGCGAAYIAYLCWRQSPRARFAAYIFLSVDVMRVIRGSHWLTVLIDLAVIIVMQMPTFRAVYPPIRPGSRPGQWPVRPASSSQPPGPLADASTNRALVTRTKSSTRSRRFIPR